LIEPVHRGDLKTWMHHQPHPIQGCEDHGSKCLKALHGLFEAMAKRHTP